MEKINFWEKKNKWFNRKWKINNAKKGTGLIFDLLCIVFLWFSMIHGRKVQTFSRHKRSHAHISPLVTSSAAACSAPYNLTENVTFHFSKIVIFFISLSYEMQCPLPVINLTSKSLQFFFLRSSSIFTLSKSFSSNFMETSSAIPCVFINTCFYNGLITLYYNKLYRRVCLFSGVWILWRSGFVILVPIFLRIVCLLCDRHEVTISCI